MIHTSYRHVYLSADEVAKRHGVTRQSINRFCRNGAIFPVLRIGQKWMISSTYVITASVGTTGGRQPAEKPPKRPRGRPPGARNKKPYPKGVKRPRIKAAQA